MNVRPLIREWRPKAAIPLSTSFAEMHVDCIFVVAPPADSLMASRQVGLVLAEAVGEHIHQPSKVGVLPSDAITPVVLMRAKLFDQRRNHDAYAAAPSRAGRQRSKPGVRTAIYSGAVWPNR
ncbi:hypothetical protein [Sphingomonas sp. PP-CE-1G-424]|uniref:hypothetical protein n=1 Tax=Sphingomonas sp. PP-CE-1G-424 TaxID=2135658 RepID=UPI00105555C4|nr:hypothetical protein [Sphingomonas sp. PP-CE-1G-424]TCP65488.1 hypothetical protein C8J43_11138 [Sphingomonas sp. PP-CE-1G-424]